MRKPNDTNTWKGNYKTHLIYSAIAKVVSVANCEKFEKNNNINTTYKKYIQKQRKQMCDNEWHSFNDEMMFEINQCYRSNSKLNSATTEKISTNNSNNATAQACQLNQCLIFRCSRVCSECERTRELTEKN